MESKNSQVTSPSHVELVEIINSRVQWAERSIRRIRYCAYLGPSEKHEALTRFRYYLWTLQDWLKYFSEKKDNPEFIAQRVRQIAQTANIQHLKAIYEALFFDVPVNRIPALPQHHPFEFQVIINGNAMQHSLPAGSLVSVAPVSKEVDYNLFLGKLVAVAHNYVGRLGRRRWMVARLTKVADDTITLTYENIINKTNSGDYQLQLKDVGVLCVVTYYEYDPEVLDQQKGGQGHE